ncbi:Bug family tripartite tricarboxylate transporter substrate binding protein [Roseomonas sp. BN140053]|uniref:Bug family tripartite tricarboxylate transporter substrate binding protein n=1 Tax=Roseomonas sp. BN140053 TaxID=3391898 RepID=UPI0039EB190B
MPNRRALLSAAACLPALLPPALPLFRPALAQTSGAAAAGTWPERPVRVIVPFPPAGSTDVLTRILCERLGNRLGQPFVLENRPGAGGNIGMDALAKAAPDGHTAAMATVGQFSINQFLYARMSWEVDRDIQPVALSYDLPNVAVVPTEHVPARTLAEFIAWAKARPGGISFGSPGVGTSPHLSGELFRSRLGIEATHVPFRGAAQTIPAMLSGDVHFALDNLPSYAPVIAEGRMRALAVTSEVRWPTMPDVPTMAEAGVPDFVVTSWAAFVMPRGVPRAVVDRFNAALREIAAEDAPRARFLQAGARLLWSTPEDAVARGRAERPMWQEAVRISGARAE